MAATAPRSSSPAALDDGPPQVAEGIVRVDAIICIPALLRELGVAPDAFLADAGLDPRLFDDPVNEISIAALGRLLGRAVARTGCPHFGLLVGQRSGLASLGLVGLLTQSSPDVGTALHHLTAHQHLRDRGGVASLRVQGGAATLGYEVCQAGVEGSDQIHDGAIAIAMNAMRILCGRGWRPSEARFCHGKSADLRPFHRVFEAALRFDAERTALVFPAFWLGRRSQAADPSAYRLLQQRVEALESRQGSDLVADLRRMLRTLLLDGKGSVGEVAERLALHRRTLNRRLQARGTSLRRLVEETRFEIGRQLVEHTRMPLVEVSAALGYADASAFTRAFRRWAGTTPARWREDSGRRRGANGQALPAAVGYARATRDARARIGRQ